MHLLLFLIAFVLFILGCFRFADRQIGAGIAFWVLACLIGPGGVSLFT